jgi:hypothetical protein
MATQHNEGRNKGQASRSLKNEQTPLKNPGRQVREAQTNEEGEFVTEDDLIPDERKLGSSAIRRNITGSQRITGSPNSPIPPRRTLQQPFTRGQSAPLVPSPRNPTWSQFIAINEPKRVHWLLYIGIGMLAMLVLWVVGSSVLAWGLARYDDYRYGYPRTFQTDAVVGHGDSPAHPSHFIAVNLHGQVIIVEFPAGSPAKSISYLGPLLVESNSDLIPVMLEFRDVNGDNKPDMLIHIGDKVFVFINDGTQFRPSNNNDPLH